MNFLRSFYLFIFRQKGREGEREGEKHQCVVASHLLPTEDLVCNSGMCPDWELNQQPFPSQAGTQSTEPQPVRVDEFFKYLKAPTFRFLASLPVLALLRTCA